MSRSLWVGGVLLLAAAGCSLDSFVAPLPGVFPHQFVVAGTVEQVSAKIQDGLSEAGVSVLTKQVGQEMRLAGQTRSGKVFCLHLYARQVEGADRVLVRVQWDREADEPFWQTVRRAAEAPDPPADTRIQ